MKLQVIIMLAVLVVLTQQAPSTDAKTITMSGSIIPAWNDIVKEWWVVWISLNRVRQYWNALQVRDQAAYAELYTSEADKKMAKAKIQAFYAGARECLNREWLPWFGPLTYAPAMKRVAACLSSKSPPPTFTVPDVIPTPTLPPIHVKFTDDTTADIQGDVPETVPQPTPEPTSVTPVVTPAPYVEPVTAAPYVEPVTAAPYVEPVPAETVVPIIAAPWESTEETSVPITYEEPFIVGGPDSLPPQDLPQDAPLDYGEPSQAPIFVTITEAPEVQTPTEIEITEPLYNQEPTQASFIPTETKQPEPVVPAEIEIAEPLYKPEPILPPAPLTVDEGEHPEPETPVQIDIPQKESEPTQAPDSFIAKETDQPEPEAPAEIVNTDPMYQPEPGTKPIEAPIVGAERPEIAEHDLPEIVPTDTPIIYFEPNAPEVPEPAEYDTSPILPVTARDEPVIEVDNQSPEVAEEAQHVEDSIIPTYEPVVTEELENPEQPEPAQYIEPEVLPPYEETSTPETAAPEPDTPVVVVYEGTNDEATSAPPAQEGAVVQYIDGGLETTSPLAYDLFVEKTKEPLPLTYTGDAPNDLSTLITEPPTKDASDVVAPPPDSYPFSPASKNVPPLWALDLDRDGKVNSDEWLTYVTRLHSIAENRVAKGQSPTAKKLLTKIVDYHYAMLQACIQKELEITEFPVLDSQAYDHFSKSIEQGCYVKFRYSLFAGAPPFQWIAKKELTVTASQIESWFNQRVAIAKHDMAFKRVLLLEPEQQEFMAKIISCVYNSLQSMGGASMNKAAFYKELNNIEQCAHSS